MRLAPAVEHTLDRGEVDGPLEVLPDGERLFAMAELIGSDRRAAVDDGVLRAVVPTQRLVGILAQAVARLHDEQRRVGVGVAAVPYELDDRAHVALLAALLEGGAF